MQRLLFFTSGKSFNYSTYAFAYNKKAVRYSEYTDAKSRKEMHFPNLTLKEVPLNQRVKWTDTKRKAFALFNNASPYSPLKTTLRLFFNFSNLLRASSSQQ